MLWRLLKPPDPTLSVRCLYLWVGAELIFCMIVLCCDTIVLCFTKLQGAVHIIEITQHSSGPPPLRDNSLDCCWRFVSLWRAVVLLHQMTVSGAVSSPLYFSCLSNRPVVHGYASHLVTPLQRETAPHLHASLHVSSWNCKGLYRNC